MKTKLNHIEIGGIGVGEASQEDIDRRALELAISDGRDHPNEIDLRQARQEFAAHEEADLDDPSDEIPEGDRSGDGFPPVDHGTRAARLEPDDEASLGQSLVEEGISEAEHDSRFHSDHGQ